MIFIRTRRSVAALVASAILGAGIAGLSTMAVARAGDSDSLRPTKKEEVREALDHLTKAQTLLSKADHDEKGYDYQALKKTEEAVGLCKKQLGIKD